jgi:hypothetical protein
MGQQRGFGVYFCHVLPLDDSGCDLNMSIHNSKSAAR